MEVQYQNTADEIRQVARHLPVARRIFWNFGWILQILACATPGTLVLVATGDLTWPLIFGGGLLLLAVVRGLLSVIGSRRRRQNSLPTMTLRLTRQYLESATELGSGRRDWSLVKRVQRTSNLLLLHLSQGRLFAVPKRAFDSEQQWSEFAQTAEHHADASVSPSDERLGPDPITETPLPPPRPLPSEIDEAWVDVHYQNSARQIAVVRQHGLASPAGPIWGGMGLAVMTLIMSLALFSTRGGSWIDRAVPNGLFLFLATFCMLWLWTMLRPLIDARSIPRELLQPLHVVIGTDGVWVSSRSSSSFEDWRAFQAIQENAQFLALIRQGRHDLFLIPKSAFIDPGREREFSTLARRYLEQSIQQVADDEMAAAPAAKETGNPYQAPGI